jgi:plastocyanin
MYLARFAPLALLLVPIQAPAQEAPQRIDIALANFKFTPATIAMKAGQSYTLHLTSTGSHNLEARTFFAAAKMEPAERAKAKDGKVDLEADESVDITLIAPAPGTYAVKCTHFMHAGFGMTGKIVVS